MSKNNEWSMVYATISVNLESSMLSEKSHPPKKLFSTFHSYGLTNGEMIFFMLLQMHSRTRVTNITLS